MTGIRGSNMSKWPLLILVAACNFGHNRLLDHDSVDGGVTPIVDAPEQGTPDAPDHPPPVDGSTGGASCTLLPQSGCTGAAPACDLTSADDGTVACREVTATGTEDDHCPVDTACAIGYTCTHDSVAADVPWCAEFCADDTGCTGGAGSRCVIALVGTQDQDLNLDVCSNACDPDAQTGCPSNMACYGFLDTGGNYTDCAYPGTIAVGDTCAHSEDCVLGAACVEQDDGNNTTTTCEYYCVVGDDTTCPDEDTCTGFSTPLTIGATEYGACL
jgi:hypothetical protein